MGSPENFFEIGPFLHFSTFVCSMKTEVTRGVRGLELSDEAQKVEFFFKYIKYPIVLIIGLETFQKRINFISMVQKHP